MSKEEIYKEFDSILCKVLDVKSVEEYAKNNNLDAMLFRWHPWMIQVMTEAYNKAIEDAADNAEIDYFEEHHDDGYTCIHSVDRESILNLKIK